MRRSTEELRDLILASQVALALNIVGDRWSFLILRDIFLGIRRFEDLRRRTDAARGTLTARLKSLVDNGLLYRNPYQSSPTRHEYRVTDKGAGLFPLALAAWRWEHDWGRDQEHATPGQLLHRDCGALTLPEVCCRDCGELVRIWDVHYAPGPGAGQVEPLPPRHQRRSRTKSSYAEGVDTRLFHLTDVMGDRWTGMVIAALFFGADHYDDIASAIGISTNILAHRLKLLTRAGIVSRKAYQHGPTRYAYRLTDKGRDLYPYTVMLHQWADQWLVGAGGAPLLLTHTTCGKALQAEMRCSECHGHLVPGSLTFQLPAGVPK